VRAAVLPTDYLQAMQAGGGGPLLLPPLDRPSDARALVDKIDGLVIAGGPDLNPARYGEGPLPSTRGWQDGRDAWEMALLDAADDANLPVLGICRGTQLMAVRGGADCISTSLTWCVTPALPKLGCTRFHGGEHRSRHAAGGTPRTAAEVQCHHHQAVVEHPSFLVGAYAADGTPEAIKMRDARCALGVQWHPETHADIRLFQTLVDASRIRTSRYLALVNAQGAPGRPGEPRHRLGPSGPAAAPSPYIVEKDNRLSSMGEQASLRQGELAGVADRLRTRRRQRGLRLWSSARHRETLSRPGMHGAGHHRRTVAEVTT